MTAATGTFGYLTSKLSKRTGEQTEERFLDTLVAVLDDIGNVNPFYTNVRNRFRLTDRIIRAPAGKTEKLFELALMSDFLDGLSGRISGQTNLAEVVNQLLTAIMHEWVSVPAPPYLRTRIFERDAFGNIKREKETVKRTDSRGRRKVDLYDHKVVTDDIIGSIIFKPHVYTLSPPTCNVLFPNMYDQMSFHEDFFNETTRLAMRPQLLTRNNKLTQGLQFMRPTELEIFTQLTRDEKKKTTGKRTPDAKFADGAGQTPNFNDYDWTTNEERIRGIVYNFINLAPAPSTLTLADPGKKQPKGTRKGGMPKYLQNVASYEYYKSKFVARQTGLGGPYNMRPVPGFPMVALDDSAANLNIVCYLDSITHSIDADGSATTEYGVKYPRLADEVDYNRPKFKSEIGAEGEIDLDLWRHPETGEFQFEQLFDGKNTPPIPEWFDEGFRNIQDLDHRYREWFGQNAGVVQSVLFEDPGKSAIESAIEAGEEVIDETTGESYFNRILEVAGTASVEFLKRAKEVEEVVEKNDEVDLLDAIKELNRRFKVARNMGREFEEASAFTDRSFTKIDQAFRFVGAAPREGADAFRSTAEDEEPVLRENFNTDAAYRYFSGVQADRIAAADALKPLYSFDQWPAADRLIDYKRFRLDHFVGDTSPGSGYSGVKEGEEPPSPVTAASDLVLDAIAAVKEKLTDEPTSAEDVAASIEAHNQVKADRMSGAFPLFDVRIHTGEEATNQKTRDLLLTDSGERANSTWARYDGRPKMFDFEFRLWQTSLKNAGYAPDNSKIEDAAEVADWYVTEAGAVRPATNEERAEAAAKRKAKVEQRKKEEEKRAKRGRSRSRKAKNLSNKDQAPTGDGLEQDQKLPLPQPLSEKQVIELRRRIVEAYIEELKKTRGFTG
jgi:hypothetical protein